LCSEEAKRREKVQIFHAKQLKLGKTHKMKLLFLYSMRSCFFRDFPVRYSQKMKEGKNSKLPGKWGRVSAAEDHLRERSDKEGISLMRFA
jgi:hypothetical protein